MGYIIKAPTGGGGGGDATAANQTTQISLQNNQLSVAQSTNDLLDNSSNPSVFKDSTINASVFKNIGGSQSLFYKSIQNTSAIGNPNSIQAISFTDTTAAGVTALLNAFLIATDCYICGLTATQSIGSHDLYLLYSV